jgi:hypothetical protein
VTKKEKKMDSMPALFLSPFVIPLYFIQGLVLGKYSPASQPGYVGDRTEKTIGPAGHFDGGTPDQPGADGNEETLPREKDL